MSVNASFSDWQDIILNLQVNEGTTFSGSVRSLGLSGAAETAAFDNFIGHLVIDNSTLTSDVITRFNQMWPANDSSLGAPFNTGDSLFDRAEAWYTDQMFLTPRRIWFDNASKVNANMFAYYFRQFIPGTDPALGGEYWSSAFLVFCRVASAVLTSVGYV
jgi:hypothetical protein